MSSLTSTSSVLLESRPFRPFKSSEEYLYAMKEDLAEWLQTMYPHLNINVDNFMEKLETGVALCEHANAVKVQAAEYVEKKQARKAMMKSITGSLGQAQLLITIPDVKYFITAKPGTFFARDNLSNFINWCRYSLKILECLLFESDDLIMRKNEKHVILCLLEVARRGAKFGMLAPMLVQMERQIDREIAADQKKFGLNDSNETNNNNNNNNELLNDGHNNDNDDDESDSEFEEEEPMLMYGPIPQIVTNDLKSLDEMVRDLVALCTCPTQFPMIRVSEGKYRIGDTKVLIFVRILRKHVMVRVGGGWDTLAHYLDKHDPCRCRGQHRPTQGARLVPSGKASDLHGAQVYYDRSAVSPASLPANLNGSGSTNGMHSLGPPMNSLNRSRSRSPTSYLYGGIDCRRSVSPNPKRSLVPPTANRSRSPTPNYISSHVTKLSTANKSPQNTAIIKNHSVPSPPPPPPPLPVPSGPQSLPYIPTSPKSINKHVASIQINPIEPKQIMKSEAVLHVNNESQNSDNHSDTSSQMSDEGYRSLGIVVQDKNNKKRSSMYSQNSCEDVEENEHQHQSLDTEDELNAIGLRKTSFSKLIYENDGKSLRKSPIRSASASPTTETDSEKTILNYQKPSQNLGSSTKSTPAPKIKERSLSDDHRISLRRTSSTDKVMEPNSINKRTATTTTKKPDSKLNTWNTRSRGGGGGGSKTCTDTSVSPFQRNLAGRRSMSAVSDHRKHSLSANTSPNHQCSLKHELLMVVKHANDDNQAALQVQQLLRKFGSTATLNGDDSCCSSSINNSPLSRHRERMSFRSPRKELRQGTNNISRIPAPVLF